jgi:Flp pilus assembly protein CpaB
MALFFSLLAGFGALTILSSLADRVTYYVVNQDVPAGVAITTDLIAAVEAPADGIAPGTLTLEEITGTTWYSKVPLAYGTVIQSSTVTDNKTLTSDLPAGYVLSTIMVDPENAVGGRIKRGDYVDIAAVSGTDLSNATAKIVMQHVLVVDVAISPADIADAAASNATGTEEVPLANENALYSGTPSMYTLAVSPQDFAKLALIRDANVYLALSAAQTPSALDVQENGASIFLPGGVTPSAPLNWANSSKPSTTTSSSAATKSEIESWYRDNIAKGHTITVDGKYMSAADASKITVDTIDLKGGTFDQTSGVWTPPTK